MRRLLFAVVTALALLAPGRAFATTPPSGGQPSDTVGATTTTIDNSFLDTKRQLTECLGNSVDLPDCGIQPKVAGDRGGSLQIITFGILALGIAFICWRVARSVKARDAALSSRAG
jgi:hypothetical protein